MGARVPVHWGEWPAWVDDAEQTPACRGVDTNLFFPDQGGAHRTKVAKAICSACPLEDQCKAWALEQPAQWLWGVWGGTTRGERIALAEPGEPPAGFRKNSTHDPERPTE